MPFDTLTTGGASGQVTTPGINAVIATSGVITVAGAYKVRVTPMFIGGAPVALDAKNWGLYVGSRKVADLIAPAALNVALPAEEFVVQVNAGEAIEVRTAVVATASVVYQALLQWGLSA